MRFKDWTGQRFGNLVVESHERKVIRAGEQWNKVIIWTCRCDCGNPLEVSSNRLTTRPPLSCIECAVQDEREKTTASQQERERAKLSKHESSPYLLDYERYRDSFTPEQRARYEEVLGGRHGRMMEREAVDVVMREPVPGICCERCLNGEALPEEATEIESDWEGEATIELSKEFTEGALKLFRGEEKGVIVLRSIKANSR